MLGHEATGLPPGAIPSIMPANIGGSRQSTQAEAWREAIYQVRHPHPHAAIRVSQSNNIFTETHRPMVITQNGRSTGVFMDIETWEAQVRKLNLLKLINEGERSLKTDKPHSIKEVEAYFKKKFAF